MLADVISIASRRRTPHHDRLSREAGGYGVGLHSPVPDQLAAAWYLANCDIDGHIRRICDIYRERRDAMVTGLRPILPGDGLHRLAATFDEASRADPTAAEHPYSRLLPEIARSRIDIENNIR